MNGVPSSHAARLSQRLLLIAVVVLIGSCRHWPYGAHGIPTFDSGPCHVKGSDPVPTPKPNPDAPIVCVDDRDLNNVKAYPDTVNAKHGAAINWFTVTGQGSMAIVFTDQSPVKLLLCTANNGVCHAVIDKDAATGPYHYGVHVGRAGLKGHQDPTVQVDPGMTVIFPPDLEVQ